MKTNISFFGVLTLILITLKLTGHIAWSWFWVLFPAFWPLMVIIGFIVMAMIILVFEIINELISGRKQ